MQAAFMELADSLMAQLRAGERLQLNAAGENSSFIRYNHCAVRQAGDVRHYRVRVRLIVGARHAAIDVDLRGQPQDAATVRPLLDELRTIVSVLPDDPHLLLPDVRADSEQIEANALPPVDQISDALLDAAAGADLVGVLAAGPVFRGFADSLGQRNWFERASFSLSTSLYAHTDKAEKVDWAGTEFDPRVLRRKVTEARRRLPLLDLAEKVLKPGEYRAYLSPDAVAALLQLSARDGFSKSAVERGYCPLLAMHQDERHLSPALHVREDTAGGLAPTFDEWGFARPAVVQVVQAGRAADLLVNPRSAAEYGVPTTGSNEWESAESVAMGAGPLAGSEAIATLETGIYVSNLHYLNYVDVSAARITGLTRFATHWVEGGEIVGPLKVMRFDDDLYRMFGSELESLTDTVELVPNPYNYNGRSTTSFRCPGAMLSSFRLAL